MITQTREDDLRDLEILHRRETLGMTAARAGYRLGKSKAAVIGFQHRVTSACADHSCACAKPENMDGGMPAKWWEA